MKNLLLFAVTIVFASMAVAQQTYRIPFASSKNSVELTVVNGSSQTASQVNVEAANMPQWLHVIQSKQTIPQLKAHEEIPVLFTFSTDKTAPVNKEQSIQFTITAPSGESWTKQIKILVAPPERFELFQNFPNPFNPTTVISYSLPVNSYVTLKVYNVLGEEVTTLVNETQEAGYKSVSFHGNNFPTGIYFYKLSTEKFLQVGKMLLAK